VPVIRKASRLGCKALYLKGMKNRRLGKANSEKALPPKKKVVIEKEKESSEEESEEVKVKHD